MMTTTEKRWLTTAEAAELMGLPVKTFRRYVAKGVIKAIIMRPENGWRRYRRDSLKIDPSCIHDLSLAGSEAQGG